MTAHHNASFQALARLLRYAKAHHGTIWLAGLCSVMNKLMDIMPEILIGMAIDVVVRQKQSFMGTVGIEEPFHQMLALGLFGWGILAILDARMDQAFVRLLHRFLRTGKQADLIFAATMDFIFCH